MATEEPKYTVLESSGPFELRAYTAMVLAETRVEGSMDVATSKGFKRIADYIFGNNISRTGGSEKISMTVPVGISPSLDSPPAEAIGIIAPVTMQQTTSEWRMYFVMPSKYSLRTLPMPNNSAVTLRELSNRRLAVLRFSGLAGQEKVAVKTAELLDWLKSKQIKPIGVPELARYNPPWTLPFLRRNEIMVAY